MSVRTLAMLFLVTSPGVVASQDVRPWIPPAQPVYVVAPNDSGELLMIHISPKVAMPTIDGTRMDGTRLYQIGMRMALFVDGQRQGDVRVEAIKEHHCNSAAALVVPTIATLSRKTVGIATNNAGIESRAGSRRNATDSEPASVVQSVVREFLRNQVATALMTRINIRSLTAIRVDDSDESTLAGSFFIQTRTERHDIFLIARVAGSQVSVEYSRYRRTTDLKDFQDNQSVELIDHLDLNDDRSDEIVLRIRGYESEEYEIYARQSGKWQLVGTSGQAGC